MPDFENLVIHTHLGLGDHFICCGLVRKLALKGDYKKYYVAVKKNNFSSVKPLYSDLENIDFIVVTQDNEVGGSLPPNSEYLRVGFFQRPWLRFDIGFYDQVGFDIKDKYEYFKINRNIEKEKEVIDKVCPQGDFIFVNNTSSSGTFDFKIDNNLPVVLPDPSLEFAAVDYLGVIEKAKEVHLLHSSFLCLTDLALNRGELFFHRVKKSSDDELNPDLRLNWTKIDY